jgi:SAM-dependent methyltransferase
MNHPVLSKLAKVRLFQKSPVNAFLRLNRWIWAHLPGSVIALPPMRVYGNFLHTLVCLVADRRQLFGTFFLRNRPQLDLIRRLTDRKGGDSGLRIAVLGSSNGAEAYSIAWTIRSAHPDLKIIMHAVDISKELLELARKGVYTLKAPDSVGGPIFERVTEGEMGAMFDREDAQVKIKSWIKEGIQWLVGDAGDPEMVNLLGPQDVVVANNFLCHMDQPGAEKCLRNIARLAEPGGYLFVSGIDLDIRTRVARDLGWKPVEDSIEEIHDGDTSVRADWPFRWWGLEPFNRGRHDWKVRYASGFQLGENNNGEFTSLKIRSLTGNVRLRLPGRCGEQRKKISFFGNFGQGNLGNESTLQAILYNLCQDFPDADVKGAFCHDFINTNYENK